MARDCVPPIQGWSLAEVIVTDTGLATKDVYGKLARYVESALRTFLHRVATLNVEFEMYCVNANELSAYTGGESFDRIEVSSPVRGN